MIDENISKELKTKLLDILKWFHCFCEKNNLTYYMFYGTMLGAARHQGFIPWDDDIDVAMPREDYNRLYQLLKNNREDRYILENPIDAGDDFFYTFSKLYDQETTLVENTKYKIKRGIYIDIFPIDGIGNDYDECIIECNKKQWLYKILLARIAGFRKGRSFYKNCIIKIMQLFPNKIIDNKNILKSLILYDTGRDFYKSKYVGSKYDINTVVPYEVMGKPKLYEFEDAEIYGVADYDRYLTSVYGDWRKFPPLKDRVPQHDFLDIDLHKSYLTK